MRSGRIKKMMSNSSLLYSVYNCSATRSCAVWDAAIGAKQKRTTQSPHRSYAPAVSTNVSMTNTIIFSTLRSSWKIAWVRDALFTSEFDSCKRSIQTMISRKTRSNSRGKADKTKISSESRSSTRQSSIHSKSTSMHLPQRACAVRNESVSMSFWTINSLNYSSHRETSSTRAVWTLLITTFRTIKISSILSTSKEASTILSGAIRHSPEYQTNEK